jgi:preprotein translocase subunit SecA
LQQKENEFFQKLNLQEAEIWSALDEPLFKHFGSEKIIQMMKQLGMKENEAIENTMISKAILSIQAKISKK